MMNFCPHCGTKLVATTVDNSLVNQCLACSFIDWNNYVNVSCVVVAYNENNQFLMVKLKGKEVGKLTFPGGYRNLGESLEEAAKREFYEETGMVIDKLALYKTYTKDEQRLVWVVYKTLINEVKFVANDEVEEILFVKNDNTIDYNQLRGVLTTSLFNDLINEKSPLL